jgi:hypothetical protein
MPDLLGTGGMDRGQGGRGGTRWGQRGDMGSTAGGGVRKETWGNGTERGNVGNTELRENRGETVQGIERAERGNTGE